MDFLKQRIMHLDMSTSRNKWLRLGMIVAIFNAAIALLLSPMNQGAVSITAMLVHSECIGFSIFGIYRLLDVAVFARRDFGMARHGISVVLAAPTGYLFGMAVAATLLGERDLSDQLLQTPLVTIGFTITATACFVYFFWSRRRLSEETAAHARAQRLAAEAQLKLLQTQIEPHMLFNTLSTLHTLIDIDPSRAQAMLDQLITYLRSTLSASRAEKITLQNEFDQLHAYLQLMSLRMGERLTFNLELPELLRSIDVPPMLLQPLVENAIKHGLEPKVEGGSITVSASLAAGQILLQVRDTGLGLQAGDSNAGYGLSNVRERVLALYGSQATVKIDSSLEQGMAVSITLPHTKP